MKKLIILVIILYSCKSKPTSYQGYVYYNNKPVSNVLVKEDNVNLTTNVKTDGNGFFKLKKDPCCISNLIFIKKGFKKDTIRTVWNQHGEKLQYQFLNKQQDTLVLKPL